MGNRTATSVEQMWEQAMANMQRGSRSANHTESTEERVEGSDTGAGKSGRGKAVREVGQAGGKESGVQSTENAERVGAPEKDTIGAEVVAAKKIPNTRPHGSPFAPREIPTAPGMSGTPINKEPFHPAPSICATYGGVERLPPTGPQCMYCGGINVVHKEDCNGIRG